VLTDESTSSPPSPETGGFLPGFDHFKAPAGFQSLSAQQQTFVLVYIQTGNQTYAAASAGYKSPNARGSELRKNPSIAAVIAQAMQRAGATPERNLARIEEATVKWHALAMASGNTDAGRKAAKLAKDYMTLLASIHGKLNLNLTGNIDVNHKVEVKPEDYDKLHSLRQGYLKMNAEAGNGLRN